MSDLAEARDAADRELRADAAERRLAARLVEVEAADAAGRLQELVKDVPPVHDQLREFTKILRAIILLRVAAGLSRGL